MRCCVIHLPADGDALLTALKQQLEFYFSPQNLAQDAFLVSQVRRTHK